VDCGWTPNTLGDSNIICPTEEIPYGIFDNFAFSGFMNSRGPNTRAYEPSVNYTRTNGYRIGVAYGFDIENINKTYALAQNLKSDLYSYVYAPAGKSTFIKNILRKLPVTELPDDEAALVVQKVALVPKNLACTDATIGRSYVDFQVMIPGRSNKAFRQDEVIPVFTNAVSGVSNYLLCYQIANTWKALDKTWVIVAAEGGCSDPDCSGSDFNVGMGRSFTDAVYLSAVIQSTIGFGDIVPTSRRARMVMSFQAVLMLGIALL
jgi:hypothetical protein